MTDAPAGPMTFAIRRLVFPPHIQSRPSKMFDRRTTVRIRLHLNLFVGKLNSLLQVHNNEAPCLKVFETVDGVDKSRLICSYIELMFFY